MNPYLLGSLIGFIFLIIVLSLCLLTIYVRTRKFFGSVAARRSLRRYGAIALLVLVYLIVGFAILSVAIGFKLASPAVFLPFFFAIVWYASTWHKRRCRLGVVLLDLGRYVEQSSEGILLIVLDIIYSVNFLISAFLNLSNGSQAAFYLLVATIFICHGIYSTLLSLSHIEIRERGICYPFLVIRWEVIAAYRWIGANRDTLCIRHEAFWPYPSLFKFQIPLAHKSRVEQLLSQYLPLEANFNWAKFG